jgi:ABC-2 type transport system permease protein
MTRHALMTVARWEYHRFAEPRDLVLSTVFIIVVFGVFAFVSRLIESKSNQPLDVAVVGAEHMGLDAVESLQRFQMLGDERGLPELEAALENKEFDALLVVSDSDRAELKVREERGWQHSLIVLVGAQAQAHRLETSDVDPQMLAALSAPVTVSPVVLGASGAGTDQADTKTVIIVISTMLVGLFLGFSYVFVAITGEKTQHVTESVLSAITPQAWIDGKILGLTLVVLVNVTCYALGYMIYKTGMTLFFGDSFSLPTGVGDPMVILILVLYAMLGFGFWFTLFALVAATITDPNSSSRSSLLFLPFLPLGLSMMGMDQPDVVWVRALALIPGLSTAAMPVRVMRGDPWVGEIVLSLLFLGAMVWVFRRAAGRVFAVSMLMTGKEPSWGEVWRWLRE